MSHNMPPNIYFNEVVIARTKPHIITYVLPLLWFALVVGLFVMAIVPKRYFDLTMIIAVLPFIYKFISNRFKSYIVTNHRVIYKEGILNRNEVVLPSMNINNVKLDANIFQRILGTGCLTIATGNESHLFLHSIKRPKEFASAISSIIETSYNKMAT